MKLFIPILPLATATVHSRTAKEVEIVYPHGQEGVLPWNFGSSSILEMGGDSVVSFPGDNGYAKQYFFFVFLAKFYYFNASETHFLFVEIVFQVGTITRSRRWFSAGSSTTFSPLLSTSSTASSCRSESSTGAAECAEWSRAAESEGELRNYGNR